MKVLNLYAGIGGNRKLWQDVEVTAVEHNEKIAKVYGDLFPEDNLVIGDAHEYLLKHFDEFDFIWSSPPCQSHSKIRQYVGVVHKGFDPLYPDLRLYQEILLLRHNFDGLWVVENVEPYYDFLIPPIIILQRHAFWSNFLIMEKEFRGDAIRSSNTIQGLEEHHGFDLSDYSIPNKRQVLRNCIYPPIGKYVFESAVTP